VNDRSYGFSSYQFTTGGIGLGAPSPVLVKRVSLAPGDAGVEQTVREMRKMVVESGSDPRWHDIALRLIPRGEALVGEGAYRQLVGGLRRVFRFVRDARGAEQVWGPDIHAGRIASLGYTWGDCDDEAIVAASTVHSINLGPIRFRAVANGKRGRELNHVFCEVLMDGAVGSRWRTLDFMGRPQPEVRYRVWPI